MRPCKIYYHLGIEKSLTSFLQQKSITSSHSTYEREVKEFISKNFPQRYSSYREFSAASCFRKKMMEHGLWEWWIQWANNHVDFARASTVDTGNIYRACNLVAKRCLQFAHPEKKHPENGYGWANITMSVLKLCVPTADVPESPESKCISIPYVFEKASDFSKIDVLFAPMQDAKASRAPEKPQLDAIRQLEWGIGDRESEMSNLSFVDSTLLWVTMTIVLIDWLYWIVLNWIVLFYS